MIDHMNVNVSDYERGREFYAQALAPLGYELMMEFDPPEGRVAGFGAEGKPDFWLREVDSSPTPIHVAFASPDRATVGEFHAAGLAAGGDDNGEPGPRPLYHEHYYGAYVHDPDGNNVEAVCHRPED